MSENILPFENVEMTGDIPLPRFGHTITAVSKTVAIMFGGAIGDAGKYTMTGDTYMFSSPKNCWTKLNIQGFLPTPRAAHACTAVDDMQLVLYGGATGGTYSYNDF
jgi:N-acetylneuraminic acid mutarotase